jgi:hypothetical protein
MFLAWMEANKKYTSGHTLTYMKFPSRFVYDSDSHCWLPREKIQAVGRLTFIPMSNRELFYMRLLLNYQVGCTSFEDIRTVKNHVHDTYHETCGVLSLLADDREFLEAIDEISFVGSGYYLRKVFTILLLSSSMSNPLKVWEVGICSK